MRLSHFTAVSSIALGSALAANDARAQTCADVRDIPGAAAPSIELEQAPERLDSRIALAGALMSRGCYVEVVTLVDAGLTLHPRSSELQLLLRDARSLQAEQVYFDGLEEAEAAARLRRFVLRCNELADIAACDAALEATPDDAELLTSKGNALAAADRLAEALAAYRRALEIAPKDPAALAATQAAETRRTEALSACSGATDAAVALRNCDVALKADVPDQFDLQKRRGLLLQQQGDNARALDAYLAAAKLRGDDRATAAAVASLTVSTGRADYVTLLAQGAALTTLGRPGEAIRVLRTAQALEPTLTDTRSLLATAESGRATAAGDCQRLGANAALPACRAALLPGAPDELELLVRTASLLRTGGDPAQARTLLQRAATLKPGDASVAAELARLEDGAPVGEGATAALPPASPVPNGSRRYSNSEPYGRTH